MSADTPEVAPGSGTSASGQRNVAIGGGVHDSTIITGDSNTIIIGPPPVPRRIPWRRIALVGVPLLAIAAATFAFYPRPMPVMSGDLNVAVAEFGALNAQGAATQSTEGKALAETLNGELGGALQSINEASSPTERRYLIQVLGPAQVGRVEGNTPQARANAAEQVAIGRNAHLVIYGYFEPRSGGTSFVPQVYLRNLQDTTPELEGQHDLGQTLAIQSLTNPTSTAQLRTDLLGRTRAFAEFVIGLSQFLNDEFANARVHFMKAETDPQWDDDSGKEVLYMFLGYTEGKLGDLTAARQYLQHGVDLNPEFARAHLGLAAVRFQESIGKPNACARDSIDPAGMQDAIRLYQRALTARIQPARSNVADWSAFGLGRAYLCLSQADAGNYWPDAEREFRLVIADYESGNESARDIAMEAHSNLGFVLLPIRCDANRDAKYRAAALEYQRAVDLAAFHRTRQAFYYEMLGFIDTQIDDLDSARAAYRNAAGVDSANKERYQQLLQNVQHPPTEACS